MWGGGNGRGGNPWGPPQQSQLPPPSQQPIHPQQGQQWSFNPNHYANVPHNQVDWAALAQQWIMLKGVGGSSSSGDHGGGISSISIPQMVGHPPPNLGPPPMHQHQQQMGYGVNPHTMPPHNGNNGSVLGGGGLTFNNHQGIIDSRIMPPGMTGGIKPGSCDILEETPMDLEPLDNTHDNIFNTEGISHWNSAVNAVPGLPHSQQTNWYSPETNNPWNTMQQKGPPGTSPVVPPPPTISNSGYSTPPAVAKAASTHPPGIIHRQGILKDKKKPTSGYQSHHPNSSVFHQEAAATGDASSYTGSGGYWSTSDNSGDGAAFPNYYSAGQTQLQVAPTQVSGYSSDENSMTDFDSAKRKTLPLWIREGLEKMEKEKLKKEEKAKMDAAREELRKRRLAEQQEQAAAEGKTVVESKWTAETESREPSDEETEPDQPVRVASPAARKGPATIKETLQEIVSRAPEHMHEELQRFTLRYATTKLLLFVTDDEIKKAAVEMVQRVEAIKRKKVTSTSTTHIKKLGALASITGGALGLGEYGSDSEQSDNEVDKFDGEEDKSDGSDDVDDLEAELHASIERKQRAWDLQLLEERKLKERSRSRSAGPVGTSLRDGDQDDELSRDKSHGRDKREVEKTVVSPDPEGNEKTTFRKNGGVELHAVPTSHLESKPNKDEIINDKDDASESNPKHRNRSRSKSRDKSRGVKDRKRKSKSRSSSRNRKSRKSRSSSRNRRKSRRSGSSSRQRSSSHSKSKRRKSRSTSRHRRRRSRSGSSSRNRNKKKSRSRSRSRTRHRKKGSQAASKAKRRDKSRSRSESKAKSNEATKSSRKDRSRSRERDRSRSNEKNEVKGSKEVVSSKSESSKKRDSRSQSGSSDSSRRRTKSKKKHKKRSKESPSSDDTYAKSKKHKDSSSSSAKVSKDKH